MGFKKALLARLGMRDKADIKGDQIPQLLSLSEKMNGIADLVNQTLLPRQIVLSDDNAELVLQSANRKIFLASCTIGSKTLFNFDFSKTPIPKLANGELSVKLTDFFEQCGDFKVSFTDIPSPDDIDAGVLSKTFFAKSKTAETAPEADLPTPENGKIETRNLPTAFLNEVESTARSSLRYNMGNTGYVSEETTRQNVVNKDDFSGINDLYSKFSPSMGQELLFVITADGTSKDAFAFALDGAEATAIELDLQKTGSITQAWQKVGSAKK
ncbi:MAG: hypothetical protein KAJ63_14090 [Methyloprofundus sp.]|nr:hypothetical protein [Methyloprofundus sp.]